MRELLIRTLSGAVLVAVIIGSILWSPWAWAAVALFVVTVGTYEMCKLQKISMRPYLLIGEAVTLGAFVVAALVALEVISMRWLLLELLFPMMPFLISLFSKQYDFKTISAYCFGSWAYLSLPASLMVFMVRQDLFGDLAGPRLLIMVFALLWVNDTFAYLTGKLLGKHKLFERISPGKTIEGSLGGLVFTLVGVILLSQYVSWLPLKAAVGMGLIAVVFGTLGDLCESMLKRQAGVKDSGSLIPGHGGILDRFDSVLFSVPFVFVYLLLL